MISLSTRVVPAIPLACRKRIATLFRRVPLCAFMNSTAGGGASVLPDGLLFSGNRVRLQVVSRQSNPFCGS